MAIRTTCIGSYPKPSYLPILDWFEMDKGLTSASGEVTRDYTRAMSDGGKDVEEAFTRATGEAVKDQISCGVDIPTDGEQRRENYIHYHCRHLNGFDFENLTRRTVRDGAYAAELPTINGGIAPKGHHFLDRDFKIAQGFSERPVKITVPGPLTILDTVVNKHYGDERRAAFDLADALNHEIRHLAETGCRYIQLDEPVFARNVARALDYGVECLERCFAGVAAPTKRVMHMCCGYPDHLDDTNYHKADPGSYFQLAGALDATSLDQISIEDAHRHNDLSLLERFPHTTIILGCVTIASSKIETVEEITTRINNALDHIDADRLIAAPDCGLAMLGRDLAMKKLTNLCQAASLVQTR